MPRPVQGNVVMPLLNAVPYAVRTCDLLMFCSRGLGKSRSGLLASLGRLERVRKVSRVLGREGGDGRAKTRWVSNKWVEKAGGAPERVRAMAESLRESLPDRRRCVSQKVKVGGQTVHYSIGLYPDGRPGELWLEVAKAGAALRTWAGEAAMMVSIALQHGTPLHTVLDLFVGTRCDPCGKVEGHNRILFCTSVMDCVARDMAITFLGRDDLADVEEWSVVPVPVSDKSELPLPVEGQTCVCHLDDKGSSPVAGVEERG